MTFTESVSTCLKKYANFDGAASRSEYWWFWLFLVVGGMVFGYFSEILGGIFNLAMLIPQLSAGARRLHDTDRSGWWQLLMFVPVIGWIVLIVFLVQDTRENRYAPSAVPV